MIIVAVILSGVLPKTVPFFKGSIHFYGEVELGFASILEMVMILAAAFLSYKTTKKKCARQIILHGMRSKRLQLCLSEYL